MLGSVCTYWFDLASAPGLRPSQGCRPASRYRPRMAGAIVFVVVMVLAVPIGVMLGGAVWSAVFGFFAVSDADQRAVGTPYEVVSDTDA